MSSKQKEGRPETVVMSNEKGTKIRVAKTDEDRYTQLGYKTVAKPRRATKTEAKD